MFSVFRDSNSHCCLRVAQRNGIVEYIALQEEAGELSVELLKMKDKEFYRQYNQELTNYPVRRAAYNYLNPLTPAIKITSQARQHLLKIMESKSMTEQSTTTAETEVAAQKKGKAAKPKFEKGVDKAVVEDTKSRAQRNIEQTEKASVKTNNKVHQAPAPAPVVIVGDVEAAVTKKKRGTWDKEETTTERNERAMNAARKEREAQKQKEALKAERKAAKSAAKKETTSATPATQRNTNSKETNMTTKTAKTTAKPAKAEAAPKAKLVKPAAEKAAPAAPAKKLAKGTGKAAAAPAKTEKAAPAKKGAKPEKAAPAKKGAKPEKAKAGRRTTFDEGSKITMLVKDNPKREGSEAYKIFELLKKSKTVGDFFAKGGTGTNLRWNIDREYIKVS